MEEVRPEAASVAPDEVFECATAGLAVVSPEGIVLRANSFAARILGMDPERLQGQPLADFVSDFHPEEHATGVRTVGGSRQDGAALSLQVGVRPLTGTQGHWLVTLVDVTDHRLLETRFRLVVESAPNAVVMVDAAGTIVLANAQAERVFGYPRADLLGQSVDSLVPHRLRDGHPAYRKGFEREAVVRPMGAGRDLFALRRDGSEFPVEIGLVPLETGEGRMFLCAIVDITERKQREQRIEAALREKELLLGEVHHRVKNHLQVVDSLLAVQARRIGDPEVQEALRDSQARIRSLSLVHQTLYQFGDFALVDFQSFLEQLLPPLVKSMAVDPGQITVDLNAQQVRLPINQAIPCGLIVNELVTNALKHGFPAGRIGRIRVSLTRGAGHDIRLEVGNDGVPLADGFAVDGGGTLGLQLVSLLGQQIDATIAVERAPATRFVLTFPGKEE